jgi:hypothetical protein
VSKNWNISRVEFENEAVIKIRRGDSNYNPGYFKGRDQEDHSSRQNISETKHSYSPSCMKGIDRRIIVQGQPRQKHQTLCEK